MKPTQNVDYVAISRDGKFAVSGGYFSLKTIEKIQEKIKEFKNEIEDLKNQFTIQEENLKLEEDLKKIKELEEKIREIKDSSKHIIKTFSLDLKTLETFSSSLAENGCSKDINSISNHLYTLQNKESIFEDLQKKLIEAKELSKKLYEILQKIEKIIPQKPASKDNNTHYFQRNTLKVWDVANGKEIQSLEDNSDDFKYIEIFPNGKQVLFVSEKKIKTLLTLFMFKSERKEIKVWDIETGNVFHRFDHQDIRSLSISPDGKYFVSCGYSLLKLWETATGKELDTIVCDSGARYVKFSLDGRWLVVGNANTTLNIYSVRLEGNQKK